jgi:hypothetical protein
MHLLISIIFIILLLRKGKWRNINIYNRTISYVIICNLLYNTLCNDKMLWQYKPDLIPNSHLLVELIYTFINLPAITILFLSSYPFSKPYLRQAGYIGLWVLGSLLVEFPLYKMGRLLLKNGYEYWMEPFFYILMYSMIRIHHTRPLVTYGFSIIIIIFLLRFFQIPIK